MFKPNRKRIENIKKDSWAFGTTKDSPFQKSGNYQISLILVKLLKLNCQLSKLKILNIKSPW